MTEREESVVIVPYDPMWPDAFRRWAVPLRTALGATARRIDHVGSTAVPGLEAKPVIDIQVSVVALEPSEPYRGPLERRGWSLPRENTDRSQRFFREPQGETRTHLHVRPLGSLDEQLTLVFRDYLRSHPEARDEYAREKRRLAALFPEERVKYVEGKGPKVWELLERAHDWAQATGWSAGPSDA
jgi:GrpB-like predicted nucleotidyltransferase (UPF0157 family)